MDVGIATSMYNNYDFYLKRWILSICNSSIIPQHVVICQAGEKYNKRNVKLALNILKKNKIKFTYLKIPFLNMGNARNKAVNTLKTKWIMYLDVDDELLRFGLKYLEKYIYKECDIIVGGLLIKKNGQKIKKFFGYFNYSKKNLLKGKWLNSHSLFKKELLEKVQYRNTEYCNNFFWADMAAINAKFKYINYLCTIYNKHNDSHSELITKRNLNDWGRNLKKFLKEIKKIDN